MLRYTVERTLDSVDTLKSLSEPGFNLGTKNNIDGGSPRRKGGGRGREKLHGHIDRGEDELS